MIVTSIRIPPDLLRDIDRESQRREKTLGVAVSRNSVITMLLREAVAMAKRAAAVATDKPPVTHVMTAARAQALREHHTEAVAPCGCVFLGIERFAACGAHPV